MQIDDEARIRGLLAAYLMADYKCELDNLWHALRIGHRSPELEHAFPDAARFCLLSAWNPHSVRQPDIVNRSQDQQLQAALEAGGLAFRQAFAAARNRSWREPSWVVVDLPVARLDALARRFGQMGALSWRRGEPGRLRMYAQEPTRRVDDAVRDCIDWVD